jgi:hypothetical protein
MSDPRLTIAWLVAFHLAGDFLFQTRAGAAGSLSTGNRTAAALSWHVLVAGLCALPVALAFGASGLAYAGVTLGSHLVIDLVASGQARPVASAGDRVRATGDEQAEELTHLGASWSPRAGTIVLLDQLAHVAVLLVAWRIFLADAPVSGTVADVATSLAGRMGSADFHGLVLAVVVGFSIVVVNVQAAALFVGTLLKPGGPPAAGNPPAVDHPAAHRQGYRIHLGPLSGAIEPDPAPSPPDAPALAPPLSVGRAIGIFERLLIAMLVVAHAEAAVALVIGVKTIARFRQLDDRAFAEYYLLGTLASVSIGVGSGLLARLVLQGT